MAKIWTKSDEVDEHRTKKITIEIEADANLADVITWMNALDGVQTKYCCEGTYIDERQTLEGVKITGVTIPGFILFYCRSESSLLTICRLFSTANEILHDTSTVARHLKMDVETKWDFDTDDNRIRYTVTWEQKTKNNEATVLFLKSLKEAISVVK